MEHGSIKVSSLKQR